MSDLIIEQPIVSCHPFYAGSAKLSGTVKKIGTPSNTPVVRRVVLFGEHPWKAKGNTRLVNLTFVAQQWSLSDGSYQFENLSPERSYTVISYDHVDDFAPAIGAGLIAT